MKNKTFRNLKLWGPVSDTQDLFLHYGIQKARHRTDRSRLKKPENADNSDKGEISQSWDIMQGIASIQNTLAVFLLRLVDQGKHHDDPRTLQIWHTVTCNM